ncbi:MAG: nucleotidyl transferase AbiEii/AbiGii toxin family protein [Planctomycetaceae bacterium]|nr:nucleotidyl transferase AbiEii/AbiGii toxin family protein [Planctomycetaceae bacterium]
MDLIQELEALAAAFAEAGVDFALCGGLAMAVHGFVRATEDIDLLIREEDLEAAGAVAAKCGFTIPGGQVPLNPGTSRAGLIYRVSKARGNILLPLDLMIVTPAYEQVWNHRIQILFGDLRVNVISRAGMIAMKQFAGRPKDQLDLDFLNQN